MSFNYSPKIVTDGLVLYLDAANTKSYVSGSTSWNDLTIINNVGTLINGASFNTLNNGSIEFDGTNQWCRLIDYPEYRNNTNMSLSVWFNFSSLPTNTLSLINKGPQDASLNRNYFWLHYTNGATPATKNLWWEGGGGSGSTDLFQLRYNWAPNINTWYNVTSTFEPNLVKIYLNGELVISSATTVSIVAANLVSSSYPFAIGTYRNNLFYNFPGKINLPMFYRKTLSQQEVLQNFNTTKSRFGIL
jgi:hypothetical protein